MVRLCSPRSMPPIYVRWSPQWSANDSCENPFLCRSSRIRFPRTFCSSCTFNSLRSHGLCVYRVLEDMIDIAYACTVIEVVPVRDRILQLGAGGGPGG